jgi:hypothetical protein
MKSQLYEVLLESSRTVMIVALFLDYNHKSTFITCYDPIGQIKVGSLLALSCSSRHIYVLLLLIIRQELGKKLHSNMFRFSVKISW